MIWQSTLLMTIVDVVMVLGALKALQILFRHRATILDMKIARPVQGIVAGLCIISGLYLADLYTMLVMPLYATDDAAMAAMRHLHLNWSWIVVLAGFAAIVAGLVYLVTKLFPQIATMIESLEAEVADHRRSAEALAKSEERLSLAVQSAKFGAWSRDIPGDRVIWDERTEAIFGLEPGTFEGTMEAFLSQVHPDDRERIKTGHRRLMEEGVPYATDFRITWPNGEVRHIATRASMVRGDRDSSRQIIGMLHDVTERMRVEDALRESEEYLRLITDNVPAVIAYVDANQRYGFINKRYEEWFGISPDEAYGRRISDVVGEAAYDIVKENLANALSGERIALETSLPIKDAGTRHVQATYVPHLSDDGGVKGVFVLVTDITERKRLEDELLRRERLSTLGQLTATVSHELRNPLGVIRTSAFILRDGIKEEMPRARRALERVERSVVRCDRIIDEMLDFTRISDLEPEPTALDDWLAGVLEEQSLPTGISLRQELQLPNLTVALDRDRFRRAVINVFDNACQAMRGEGEAESEPAERVLTVRTRERDGRIEVVFEDRGPGIPPDVYERIFEPLYSTKGFGVGLGLPVVKQIMEQHGGGIEIETEEGRGTAVCLWLDRNARAEDAAA
ncbi:MAG: PAS domain S-box protein [Proteobacteria bacterium]|nr:PAS domain S-box protein [Pseudomonadota bacterium]